MNFLDRFWRRLSGGDAAIKAELEGNLPLAVQLWMQAGAVDEAARVMILRGDGEADPKARLQHYAQATATATPDGPTEKAARAKKAHLTVVLAKDGALSAAIRRDVQQAAEDLARAGEAEAAAEAFALAGDNEGEAQALAAAGEVERLEALLTRSQTKAHEGRVSEDTLADVEALVSAGQRREALARAEAAADAPLARSRAERLRSARITGPIIRITRGDETQCIVLGDEVTIGRSEATINVASSALSRRHVALSRTTRGQVALRDLGSRNGTQLRGLNVAHDLDVSEGLLVSLGGSVPLHVAPSAALANAVLVEVGGGRYVAPLGPAVLGIGAWQLATAADGWVELVTFGGPDAFVGELVLGQRITLLRGDAFASVRGGPVVLRIDE